MGGPNMPQTNPRWRTAAILKSGTFMRLDNWTPTANKFREFENPRWRQPPFKKFF